MHLSWIAGLFSAAIARVREFLPGWAWGCSLAACGLWAVLFAGSLSIPASIAAIVGAVLVTVGVLEIQDSI